MVFVIHTGILVVGALFALQGVLNTKLSTFLAHPLQSSLISFTVGTAFLFFINLALKKNIPDLQQMKVIPWYLFLGGIIGAVVISSAIFLIPKIGVGAFTFGIIASQLIGSMVMEHYGILGVAVRSFDWKKALAVVCMLSGYMLVNWDRR